MLQQFLIFLAGRGILYLGAEWLVRGAASLALRFGIRPLVVGLTVVALGTSMPEFLVNFFAAFSDEDSLALGNIIGSNICNIALILGLSAIILPLSVRPEILRKEYPMMVFVSLLFYLLSLDGVISKLDGLLLVLLLVAFLLFLVIDTRRHADRQKLEAVTALPEGDALMSVPKKVAFLLGGMVMLTIGARLMVYGATNIAESMGISNIVIGLTVVAIGTSLPELAASVVGALKNEADLSVGNILGSNLLNVLFVVGLVALIRPLQVDPASISIHFPVMIGFTVLLLPLAWTQYRITRLEGGLLVTGFVAYMVYLLVPYV
jgi:cation:H+ antiporter